MIYPEQNWWYGPKNPVNLSDICQAGATAIATALYEVPKEEEWAKEAIPDRKKIIEQNHNVILSKAGDLRWRIMLLQVFFFTFLVQSIARKQQQDLLTTANDRSTDLSQLQSKHLSQLSHKRLAETEAKRCTVKQKRVINT